jgi:structure-specific recognition protein 1
MQVSKEQVEITINRSEEVLKQKYNDELQKTMSGSLSNVIAKVFKIVTGKKVFVPGKYASARKSQCVSCANKASEGYLYPLEKQFIWLHKPPIVVRYDEIESVEFQRYHQGSSSSTTRNFDLAVVLKGSAAKTQGVKEYVFTAIDRGEYKNLNEYVVSKKIRVRNAVVVNNKANYNEGSDDDAPRAREADEDDESEDDEDYDADAAQKDEDAAAANDSGSDSDDSSMSEGSDIENARGGSGNKRKKAASTPKKKPAAKGKKGKKKDPNAPKKPISSFFYFSGAMRPKIKEENPDLPVTEIAKKIGEAWKEISAEDKVQYQEKADQDKARYEKEMESYEPPSSDSDSDSSSSSDDSDDSDGGKKKKKGKKSPKKKAKKVVDPNAPKGAKGSYMFFTGENREKIKAENPDLTFGELAKKIGEAWKEMSAEDKVPYEEMAAADKERFKTETAAYEQMKAEALAMSDSSDSDNEGGGGGGEVRTMEDSDSD